MAGAKDVLKMIKDNDVKFVDLRFTDPRGKWQHVTFDVAIIDEDTFTEGVMFDGSSIAGWKVINESDMKLMPDPITATIDPFFAQTTLSVVCDILEPLTDEPYERDPRSIAKKAEAYLKQTKIGDTVVFGPEAEFFVFDDVKFAATPYNTGFKIDDIELPINSRPGLRDGQSRPPHAHRRAATSRFRRRTPCRTCAPRCCRRWRRWASRPRSTTTRSARLSTSSA